MLAIALLPAIATFISGSLSIYAWQRREINGARAFGLCAASIFIWCFFSIFEYLSLGETARIIFGKAQYLGISTFPLFWLLFTLQYAQSDRWLTQRLIAALSVIPTLTLILAFTDPWHGWIWQSAYLEITTFPKLVIAHGWWFDYVLMPQSYALVMAGFAVLLKASFVGSGLYRRQTLILMGAAMLPFISNVLYIISDITLYGLDLTPVGFALGGCLIHFGLFQARFLDVAPISYKTVFISTADAVILLDAQQRIVDLNPSAVRESWQVKSARAAIGLYLRDIFPDYGELFAQPFSVQTTQTQWAQTVQLPAKLPNKHTGQPEAAFREVTVRSLLSPRKRTVGWVVMIRDVTLEKQQQDQLEQFAYIDSLTGLPNRRQLELKAEEALTNTSAGQMTVTPVSPTHPSQPLPQPVGNTTNQMGYDAVAPTLTPTSLDTPASLETHKQIALLYIDLNHFKPINDTYGHDIGDAVLQHFAKCLSQSVRKGDIVARLGGDEFAALLYDAGSTAAREVCARLTHRLHRRVTIANHTFALSASIGIAYYPDDGNTLQALMRKADEKMYREKRLSRKL